MANSSFVITISTPITSATMVNKYLLSSTVPRNECTALSTLFKRIADGLTPASFDVQYNSAAPVRATNTLTLTYASISNNDTCVIAGTTLTCVTGTPSGSAQFKKQTDATVTATNLVNCINANPTLSALMTATSVAGVVTMTIKIPGALGNQVPLVGSTGMAAGAATFANGAGGATSTVVTYTRS